MFIVPLGNWIQLESTPQSQAVCTLECRPLNQPITLHLVPDKYNNINYFEKPDHNTKQKVANFSGLQ